MQFLHITSTRGVKSLKQATDCSVKKRRDGVEFVIASMPVSGEQL
jgi:hypothetical protein